MVVASYRYAAVVAVALFILLIVCSANPIRQVLEAIAIQHIVAVANPFFAFVINQLQEKAAVNPRIAGLFVFLAVWALAGLVYAMWKVG